MLGHLPILRGISFTLGPAAARIAITSAVMGIAVTGVAIATFGPIFIDTEVVRADSFEAGCWTSAKWDGFGNREIRLV